MTPGGIVGALVLIVGFGGALALVVPVATRRRLGILHPAVAWLGLEAVFFGVGSLALSLGEDRPGAAIYLGACVLATGIGVWLASRFGPFAATPTPPPDPASRPVAESGLRRWVPAILAVVAVTLIAPIIIDTGLPLLSSDATGARVALAGLSVQFVRVAIPALAAVLLLEMLGGRPAFGRAVATWLIIGVLTALMVAMASRYLVAELAAGLLLAWLLTGRPIPVKAAALVAVVAVVTFVAIGVLRAPDDFTTDTGSVAAQRTLSRLFLVQPRTLDALQATIPSEQPYFLGLTWFRRLGPLIGRDDIPNLGYWIYPTVVDAPQEVAGYAAPGLIGEAWANFGPAGVGLFVLFGVVIEGLAAWIAAHRERVVDIAAAALAIVFVARTHALGLLGVGVLIALLAGWWILSGARLHMKEVPVSTAG